MAVQQVYHDTLTMTSSMKELLCWYFLFLEGVGADAGEGIASSSSSLKDPKLYEEQQFS